jgi:hypothetical protein
MYFLYSFNVKKQANYILSIYIYKEKLIHIPITSHYPFPQLLLYIPSQVDVL